jgi:hypothetical protein
MCHKGQITQWNGSEENAIKNVIGSTKEAARNNK